MKKLLMALLVVFMLAGVAWAADDFKPIWDYGHAYDDVMWQGDLQYWEYVAANGPRTSAVEIVSVTMDEDGYSVTAKLHYWWPKVGELRDGWPCFKYGGSGCLPWE